jgi:hypothetical protein
MSRHIAYSDEKIEVIVGYDPPLRSFFYQVWDKEKIEDEDAMLDWGGADRFNKINTVAVLQLKLKNYCIIPEEIKTKLKDEKDDDAERPDSPIMKLLKEKGLF